MSAHDSPQLDVFPPARDWAIGWAWCLTDGEQAWIGGMVQVVIADKIAC
ncbi:hypothetical protein [Xanthomonas sacchari]|nr:hypothetical protein [Xanthomonas sacchari]